MKSTFQGSLSRVEAAELHEHGLLHEARRRGYLPVIAGGSPTSYADPITNPLSAPTVSGTSLTIDFFLNNPTRITRRVADLVMRNFFLDKVFDMGGDVQGGALLYDQATTIDVYTDRDVERMQPGTEAPILTGARIAPLVAPVEKFGGKFPVTDEQKRRNDVSRVTNQMRRVANTITRKMQQRGIAELEAAISSFSRTTAAEATWKAAAEEAMLNRKAINNPMGAVWKAIEAMELLEMGYAFDTLIVSPKDAYLLRTFFGEQANVMAALADVGITNLVVTPRKAAKTAILTAGKMVGTMRLEEPMRTETEREGAPLLRQQTWIQTTVNPVFAVTDPYAAMEITGLS
jgi:hypothetical protein